MTARIRLEVNAKSRERSANSDRLTTPAQIPFRIDAAVLILNLNRSGYSAGISWKRFHRQTTGMARTRTGGLGCWTGYHFCLVSELAVHKFEGAWPRLCPGRPPLGRNITERILGLAPENSGWRCNRILGALAILGHRVRVLDGHRFLHRRGAHLARLGMASYLLRLNTG